MFLFVQASEEKKLSKEKLRARWLKTDNLF